MKNYILALILIPMLVHGQKFRDSEVRFTKDDIGGRASKTVSMERVPRLLSYQGFLTVGNAGPVNDGQYTVDFRLFDEEEGGSEFWTETHLLTIADGLVSALLGSNGFPIETVPMNSYLEIEIDGNVLSPRQQITSVLYSVMSDTTNFAKGYTKTADLADVALSGEYSDLFNTPDLTPFATKDSLSYYTSLDSLASYTLTSQLSLVAFSNNYQDLDSLPNLASFALTDTLSYYVTEVLFDSTIEDYVSHDTLDTLIGTTIQRYDSDLEDIARLDEDDDLGHVHLIIYDNDERKWISEGDSALRATLGLGDMSIQEPESVNITGGRIVGIELDSLIEPIAIADGGTGAPNADSARVNLGLEINEDVQAHSDDLYRISTFQHSDENQIMISLAGGIDQWNIVNAETARDELGLKIGATADSGNVQAWNRKLQNYADGGKIPAENIEHGQYFIDTAGVNGQFWSSDNDEAGIWRTFSRHFNTVTEDTISIKTGVAVGDIVELELGYHGAEAVVMLPEVDGSPLRGLNAEQINITREYPGPVSNEEFILLQDLRSAV
ncbi:MAG: hypothetical protein MK299_12745, partial [Pseudomonadales bacterium]|nr:hypothetical protein [Pseudomonadales bacterium]